MTLLDLSTGARRRARLRDHPLFPTAAALWCMALFSLSTLAVRGDLLEHALLASHLAAVVPVLAPSLSLPARLALAAVMGGIGACVGLVLAQAIMRPRRSETGAGDLDDVSEEEASAPMPAEPVLPRIAPVAVREPVRIRPRDAHPDAPPRAPIRAHEEFGFDLAAPDIDDAPPLPAPTLVPAPAPVALVASNLAHFPPSHAGPTAAERIAGAPLEDLSPVELVERLAIAMQRHGEQAGTDHLEGGNVEERLSEALASLRALG